MSLFSLKSVSQRVGVVIDIGSGSVLAAIVVSDERKKNPTVVWNHREHAPLKNIESLDQSSKAVMTSLLNALLKLDVEGRRALNEYNKSLRITQMQCSISAPWAYTVTKTINYTQDNPFEISQNLIDELIRTATQKITEELAENESTSTLGLCVITRSTMDLLANGYRVKNFFGAQANELSIKHASVVTQQYLVDQVDELKEKMFPAVEIQRISYMLILHSVVQDLFPNAYDVCLVNITYEATEIGIVRDGTLRYSTHTPFGSFSLAREISEITSVPLYEAFQYLHTEKPYAFMDALPARQKEEVEKVFEAYTERISTLFGETGDELSIPKRIILHADLASEPLFKEIIENAAKRNLKSQPHVKVLSKSIVESSIEDDEEIALPQDTAMLVSAQFFHKQNRNRSFEYL